jgi:signal transduction histidine kinase
VVAHQLSAIAVQAGSARIAASSPAQVLATVEQLAREALTELNHLLGALRREPADDLTRPPAPTLTDLEPLLAGARAAGVPVTLTVEGAPRALSPGVELSCYRIIAEALTNVGRHAPAAPSSVILRYQSDALGIEVTNGPSPLAHRPTLPRSAPGGRGVRGMRERAELYGGCLVAQASPDGGFSVAAQIPCPGIGAGITASPAQERT